MNVARKFPLCFGCAALLGTLALGVLRAEDTVAPSAAARIAEPVTGNEELAHFGLFLDEHPVVENRLEENMAVLDNPAFLRNHPFVAQFLARHPELAAQLAAHPRWILHRELRRMAGSPLSREQIAEFDHILNQHPELERQLLQHPSLLRRTDFVRNHPDLHEFVKRHARFEPPRH
jgi:hypothetical protein